jgi:hypothetical protein
VKNYSGYQCDEVNGWSRLANNPNSRYGYKSPCRRQLIDSKYGKVIDAPNLVE